MPDASGEKATASPGAPWTPSTGECPRDAAASTLWQILEADVPRRYYLTTKACQGILRRIQRRGKLPPPLLMAALEEGANA